MRLFVALEPNSRAVTSLTELVRRLAPIAPICWVHPKNMHISLKYIGDWEEDRLDEVVDALNSVRFVGTLKFALAGLGFYPTAQDPRVFWVIAERTPSLLQLASRIDMALTRLGVAPEVRSYFPHLTLGRLPAGCDLTELHEAIEELPSRDFGFIEPDSFALYSSRRTPQGPVYTQIEEFPLLMRVPKVEAPRLARRA